jgi:hypothetical protein
MAGQVSPASILRDEVAGRDGQDAQNTEICSAWPMGGTELTPAPIADIGACFAVWWSRTVLFLTCQLRSTGPSRA